MDAPTRSELLAAYAIERQDDSTALAVAFAITTTCLTYVIAATAFFTDHCQSLKCDGKIPAWLPLVAPAVAISFVGFLVLNVAASRMRSVHLQRLEAMILLPVRDGRFEPSFHSDAGLIYRPDRPLAAPRIRLVFATITVASYVVIMSGLMGFTWYIFFFASGPWTVTKYAVGAIYGLLEIVEVIGFAWPLTHRRFVYERPGGLLPR
jgi:hypothetical protein